MADPVEPPARADPPGRPEPETITRYRNVPDDAGLRRMREAMRLVGEQYPRARAFLNITENAYRLIQSGERQSA